MKHGMQTHMTCIKARVHKVTIKGKQTHMPCIKERVHKASAKEIENDKYEACMHYSLKFVNLPARIAFLLILKLLNIQFEP